MTVLQKCSPESSMKLACLSAVEEMLLPVRFLSNECTFFIFLACLWSVHIFIHDNSLFLIEGRTPFVWLLLFV